MRACVCARVGWGTGGSLVLRNCGRGNMMVRRVVCNMTVLLSTFLTGLLVVWKPPHRRRVFRNETHRVVHLRLREPVQAGMW